MSRLEVKVGANPQSMEVCRLNDMHRPHEINTEHFVGRVLIRILNAPGAKEGEEGREYFEGRSRKFCIQIEGRFKKPYKGSEVLFGTDFDKFISFPRAPFTAGMRVAQMIDPCTFYDEHPPSGRPYIMSPYCACMNTLCAWPAPSRAHDAVVVLRHAPGGTGTGTGTLGTPASGNTSAHASPRPVLKDLPSGGAPADPVHAGGAGGALVASPHASDDEGDGEDDDDGDVVPVEALERHADDPAAAAAAAAQQSKRRSWFGSRAPPKEERKLKKYWRFVGFKQDPRVRAFLEAHHASLEKLDRQPSRNSHSGRATPSTPRITSGASAGASLPASAKMSPNPSTQGSSSAAASTHASVPAQAPAPEPVQPHAAEESTASAGPVSSANEAPAPPSPVVPPGYVFSSQGGIVIPPERPFSPDSASGAKQAAGTIATGAVNMPLLQRLGTGLRDQGGRTPPPPRTVSPSLAAHGEPIPRGPSPLRHEAQAAQQQASPKDSPSANANGRQVSPPQRQSSLATTADQSSIGGGGGNVPSRTATESTVGTSDNALGLVGSGEGNGSPAGSAAAGKEHAHHHHHHKKHLSLGFGGLMGHGHKEHKDREHKEHKERENSTSSSAGSKPTRRISLHNPLKVLRPKAALNALNLGKKDDLSDGEGADAADTSAGSGSLKAKKSHSRTSSVGAADAQHVRDAQAAAPQTTPSEPAQSAAPAMAVASASSAPAEAEDDEEDAPGTARTIEESIYESAPSSAATTPASTPAREKEEEEQAPALPEKDEQPQPQIASSSQLVAEPEHLKPQKAPMGPPLQRISTSIREEMQKSATRDGLTEGDFKLADRLRQTHLASPPPPPPPHHHQQHGLASTASRASTASHGKQASRQASGASAAQQGEAGGSSSGDGSGDAGEWHSQLDAELGPWRFSDPATDMIEDNAFIFTHESVSVPRRRKHFANKQNREDFVYDPDVVYGAAFFSDMMDFNTFDLHIGPVRINVNRFFRDMPVRYTLRTADESVTFCTVSFQLV